MRLHLTVIFLLLIIWSGCQSNQKKVSEALALNSDSLICNIDKYNGREVQIEGTVVHVCGVDGMKMKLLTDGGNIIRIFPDSSCKRFDGSLYNKRVKVSGFVKETRQDEEYIDRQEEEKALLCHIDNTPCKDTAWANRKIQQGKADSISEAGIANLRTKIRDSKKGYISVVSVYADTVIIVNSAH